MRGSPNLGRAGGIFLLWMLCLVLAAPASAGQADFGAGGWCWFQDPRAITHTGQHTRTYVGWITPQGDITVGSYDHGSGQNVSSVLRTLFQEDDHASPALQVRPDGRIVAFYARHSEAPLYYRVSERPEDITSWGPERQITTNTPGSYGFTYPNPIRLPAESRTYLFWRGASVKPTFSTQADGSEEWAAARQLMTAGINQRPYVKYASNGLDTIHMAFTEGHPKEVPGNSSNIYYARYRAGLIERADGSRIAQLSDGPFAPEQGDKVYDTPRPAWVHDTAVGPDGKPVIVFASFPDHLSRTGHIYHYARWTGTAWEVNEITAAGGSITTDASSPLYSGGLTLAHEDPTRVYLSRQVGSAWWVEAWSTADGGRTWSSRTLTQGSTEKNVRPLSPRGAEPFGEMVVWMGGEYPNYESIQTRVTGFIEDPPGATFPPVEQPAAGGDPQQPSPAATSQPGVEAPRIARVTLTARVRINRRGRGRLPVGCRAGAGDRCLVAGSVRVAGAGIGTLRGEIAGGRRGGLRVRLTRRGLVKLRRARGLKARLAATSVSRSGRRTRAARTVRLTFASSR